MTGLAIFGDRSVDISEVARRNKRWAIRTGKEKE
jgi:hypothetical protein